MSKDELSRQATDVSEAQIAVHWREEAKFSPSNRFIAQANLTDPGVIERFSLDKSSPRSLRPPKTAIRSTRF